MSVSFANCLSHNAITSHKSGWQYRAEWFLSHWTSKEAPGW